MNTRLHRSEINRQINRLRRIHGVTITSRQFADALGFPLIEANFDQLKGIIAALEAINTNADHDCHLALVSRETTYAAVDPVAYRESPEHCTCGHLWSIHSAEGCNALCGDGFTAKVWDCTCTPVPADTEAVQS